MASTRIARNAGKKPATSVAAQVRAALAALERAGQRKAREDMEKRYGIVVKKAWGVPMGAMQKVARGLGRNHALALALWETGWYEARTVAAYVDDPALVTPAQMDRWCRDFDNWGIVDTVCFVLFDRSPHAWKKVEAWSGRRDEFQKRAGLVLLACLALHDKTVGDNAFLRLLPLAVRAAPDGRNFVKKGNSWALRSIGRRSPALNAAVTGLAKRLAESEDSPSRSLGKEVLREITSPKVRKSLAARSRASA
jgi:3-methyladenine DNA glycosylase AlkD